MSNTTIISPTYANTRASSVSPWIPFDVGTPTEGLLCEVVLSYEVVRRLFYKERFWRFDLKYGQVIQPLDTHVWRYAPGQTYWFPPTDIPPEDDLILAEYETGGGLQFWVGYFQPDGSLDDDNGAIVLDQDKDDFVAWQFVTRWQPIEGV